MCIRDRHYTNQGFSLADVMQFKVVGNGTIFFDNFYFVQNATLSTSEFAAREFSLFPNPAQNEWNIKSVNQNISAIEVFDLRGQRVMHMKTNALEVSIDASLLSTGLYIARVETVEGVGSLKLIKK